MAENPRDIIKRVRALAESGGLNDPGDMDPKQIIRSAAARVLQEQAFKSGNQEEIARIRDRLYQQPRNFQTDPVGLEDVGITGAKKLAYHAIRGADEINSITLPAEQVGLPGKIPSWLPQTRMRVSDGQVVLEKSGREPTPEEQMKAQRDADYLRQVEQQDIQENFSSRLARGAGGVSQFLMNLGALKGLPGMGGKGVASGMARFGAHEAALPEIKEAQGGPEAQGTMPGRFAKGALIDLALRGMGGAAGKFAQKAVPGTGRAADVARGTMTQGAVGGTFGAAMAPEGERGQEALTNAILFGGMGAAGARPFSPKQAPGVERPAGTGVAERGSQRVETEPYDPTRGPELKPREGVSPELTKPQPSEYVKKPVERPIRTRETPSELGLPEGTMEAFESKEYRTFILPDGKRMRVLPEPKGEGVVQETPKSLEQIKAESEQRQLPPPEVAPEPKTAQRIDLPEEAPAPAPESGVEFRKGGFPLPEGKKGKEVKEAKIGKAVGGLLSTAKETFLEPGVATEKGMVAAKQRNKLIAKGLEKMSPRLRRFMGAETPDKMLEGLNKEHRVGLDKVREQLLKTEEIGAKLPKKDQLEFWRTLEKNGELPPDHPLKEVEQEYKDLVLKAGDAMVRSDPDFFKAVEAHRQPGEGYVKRVPSKEQLATDLSKRAKELMKGLANWKMSGLKTVSGAHAKALESAKKRRLPYTTEEIEGTRVFLKSRGPNGKPVHGKLIAKDKKTITLESAAGKSMVIPRSNIRRIDKPYQAGLPVVLKTIEEQGAIYHGLKVFERVVDEPQFKDYWAEPQGEKAPPGFVRVNDPSFGVLNGKDLHETLYNHLRPITSKEQPGWKKLLWTINGSEKEGVTIGRVPGYPVKNVLGEAPMMMIAGGVSPVWMPVRAAQGIKAVFNYLKTGKKDRYIAALIRGLDGRSLFMTNPHLQDMLEGGADYKIANFRDVPGRGPIYIKNWLTHSLANAQTRLSEMAKRRAAKKEDTSVMGTLAEVYQIIRDSIWGADIGRALGARSDRIRLSGEGVRDLVAIIDATTRYAVFRHLVETGGVGELRMAGRVLAGKKPIPKGMSEQAALEKVRQLTDPASVKGPMNTVGRLTFLRAPFQIARHFIWEGGALVNPIGAYLTWQIGQVVTATTLEMGRKLWGWTVSDEEIEKQMEQVTYGNKDQIRTIGLIGGEMISGKFHGQFGDMLAFSLADIPFGVIPGRNVQPKANEPGIRRVIRGAAAQIPIASKLWRIFEGEEPLTGMPLKDKSFKRQFAEGAVGFLPGAATYAQRIRGEESIARAERSGRAPVAGKSELLKRGLTGIKWMKGYPSDSKEGKEQKKLIEYLKQKKSTIELPGVEFKSPEQRRPKHPGADATEEEMEQFNVLMRAYMRSRRPRRRR